MSLIDTLSLIGIFTLPESNLRSSIRHTITEFLRILLRSFDMNYTN